LEIAVNRGNAASDLGGECGVGTAVVVHFGDSPNH
jgi:hypothetical protein